MSFGLTPAAASDTRFGQLLAETLAEVDAAEAIDAADARQAMDEVEQLRLRAAQLVTAHGDGPWPTGAIVQFQQDPSVSHLAPPTMDIRFPARPAQRELPAGATPAEQGGNRAAGRQGRRVP